MRSPYISVHKPTAHETILTLKHLDYYIDGRSNILVLKKILAELFSESKKREKRKKALLHKIRFFVRILKKKLRISQIYKHQKQSLSKSLYIKLN